MTNLITAAFHLLFLWGKKMKIASDMGAAVEFFVGVNNGC